LPFAAVCTFKNFAIVKKFNGLNKL